MWLSFDQRIPRYERDIINMVGMGVTENAALQPNVKEGAVGFSVTFVRAKTGKGAALHRHATEEVFIPVKGGWGRGGATSVRLRAATTKTLKQAMTAAWCNSAPKKVALEFEARLK